MAKSTRAVRALCAVHAQQTPTFECVKMQLDTLRDKVIYQNTIDTWIALCEERKSEWYDIKLYKGFIKHLLAKEVAIKKFPLCIKEAGGEYSRGRDKTTFSEELESNPEDHNGSNLAAAYTVKLSDSTLGIIRQFSN